MDDAGHWVDAGDGVARLRGPVRLHQGWAWSPDGAYLAVIDADGARARCVEAASGREVFVVAPRAPVRAVAWASREALWVVHGGDGDATLEAVAAPDGGALGAVQLVGLRSASVRVTASHDGALALVAPWCWRTAPTRAAGESASLVRAASLEVLATLPDDRHAVKVLGPDGALAASAWGGGNAYVPDVGERGRVDVFDPRTGALAWRHRGGWGGVQDVVWPSPDRLVVVRSPTGFATSARVTVLALARGTSEAVACYDTYAAGDDVNERGAPWVGPVPALEVSPERDRLLVCGWTTTERVTVGTVAEVDLRAGRLVVAATTGETPSLATGATWVGDAGAVAVLSADGPGRAAVALREGVGGASRPWFALALAGRGPTRARLARAPRGGLVVTWVVNEGRALATRLAWRPPG